MSSTNDLQNIGENLRLSEEFLLDEIERLKSEFVRQSQKLQFARDLQTIDEKTLRTFENQLNEINELLHRVRQRETNARHLIEILRANTSRLWTIFQSAIGMTFVHEDSTELIESAEKILVEQNEFLSEIERRHGDLVILSKEIQIDLKRFREKLLEEDSTNRRIEKEIEDEKHFQRQIDEQREKRVNLLEKNLDEIFPLLFDLKMLIDQMKSIEKSIEINHQEIERHHKSMVHAEITLVKLQQNRTSLLLEQSQTADQCETVRENLVEQMKNLRRIDERSKQIEMQRKNLDEQIENLRKSEENLHDKQIELISSIKQIEIPRSTVRRVSFRFEKVRRAEEKHFALTKSIEIHRRRSREIHEQIDERTRRIDDETRRIENEEKRLDHLTTKINSFENATKKIRDEFVEQQKKIDENRSKTKIIEEKIFKLTKDEKIIGVETSIVKEKFLRNRRKENELKTNGEKLVVHVEQMKRKNRRWTNLIDENDEKLQRNRIDLKRYEKKIERCRTPIDVEPIVVDRNEEEKTIELKRKQIENERIFQKLGEDFHLEKLYGEIRRLKNESFQHARLSKRNCEDLKILMKYFQELKSKNGELRRALVRENEKNNEFVHGESKMTRLIRFERESQQVKHVLHHSNALKMQSATLFDHMTKIFLIKKKLVEKSSEIVSLRTIFKKKFFLYQQLSRIYDRRETMSQ